MAAPCDHRVKHAFRFGLAELLAQQARERRVGQLPARLLFEAVADVRGQRHVGEQLLAEDLLPQRVRPFHVAAPEGGELQVAAFELRQAEQRHRMRDRQQLGVGELGVLGQLGKIGAAVERLVGQQLENAVHARHVGFGQALRERRGLGRFGQAARAAGAGRHQRIQLVDERAHVRAVGVARPR